MASTLPVRADSAGSTASFWQRPFVQDVLPLVTSLLLHGALIALGIITYRAVSVMIEVSKTPTVIPEHVTPINADVSAIPQFRGLADDPTRRAGEGKNSGWAENGAGGAG